MNRKPELDVLRAIAVTLVMLLHAEAFPVTTRMGWAGVDLFFVLSGFLVSGLLFSEYRKEGKIRLGRFLARRGLKIYPAFYAVLILHLVYYAWKGIPVASGKILAEIFFYQNYLPGLMGISWSLAIEEHFYFLVVIAAWLLMLMPRLRSVRAVITVCVFIGILCFSLRLYTYLHDGPVSVFVNDFPTHLRIDSLAFGLLLSCLYHFRLEMFLNFFRRYWKVLLPIALLALLPVFLYDRRTLIVNSFGYTLLYLGFGVIVSLAVVFGQKFREWASGLHLNKVVDTLAFIGRYSYTIYLCHFIVGTGMVSITKQYLSTNLPHFIYILVYLLSCIAAGILLSLVIEQPFLRLREKVFRAESGFAPKLAKAEERRE